MNMLKIVAPGLKVLFERVGKPEIVNQPDLLRPGGAGAIIACNHVGWADGLWVAYAVHPRQLRHMSKQELFASPLTKWVMQQAGSISIKRSDPSPSSIKTAVDILKQGEVLLIFPSGTRNNEMTAFKRGAATIALQARVPLVPAFYEGPPQMQVAHLMDRPRVKLTFGAPIPTDKLTLGKDTISALTSELETAIHALKAATEYEPFAA